MPKELFSLSRSGIKEVIAYAEWIAVVGDEVISKSWEGQNVPKVVARSLLKPFQALATKCSFEDPSEVMALSSHSGEKVHEDALIRLRERCELSLSDLILKPSYPMDPIRTEYLKRADVSSSVMFHPCCGKHLIYAASGRGSDKPYQATESDIHKRLTALVRSYVGHNGNWVLDSCGLPTLVATMDDHARLWSSLVADNDPRVRRLIQLWSENPVLVGGTQRLDSQIVSSSKASFLAKEGADGLLMVQSVPAVEKKNVSVFLKLAAGYNASHLTLGLSAIAERLPYKSQAWSGLLQYLDQKKKVIVPADQMFANNM